MTRIFHVSVSPPLNITEYHHAPVTHFPESSTWTQLPADVLKRESYSPKPSADIPAGKSCCHSEPQFHLS